MESPYLTCEPATTSISLRVTPDGTIVSYKNAETQLPATADISVQNCTITIRHSEVLITSPTSINFLLATAYRQQDSTEPKKREYKTPPIWHLGLTPLTSFKRSPHFQLTIYKEVLERLITECTNTKPERNAIETIQALIPTISKDSATTYAYAYRDYILQSELLPPGIKQSQLFSFFPKPKGIILTEPKQAEPKAEHHIPINQWATIGFINQHEIYDTIFNTIISEQRRQQLPLDKITIITIKQAIVSCYKRSHRTLAPSQIISLAYSYKAFIDKLPTDTLNKIYSKLPNQFSRQQVLSLIPSTYMQHQVREHITNLALTWYSITEQCHKEPSLDLFIKP